LVDEIGVPGENHRPADKHLSHSIVSSTPALVGFELATLIVIGTDCIGSHKSDYNTITTTTAPVISYTCSI